jgi:hypothetical protein
VQRYRGTRTRSRSGCPTTGTSVTLRNDGVAVDTLTTAAWTVAAAVVEQVAEHHRDIAVDSGVSDRHTEFNSAHDRVGNNSSGQGRAPLEELAQLGRTLHRRRHDVLAYFDHHASNGPTEAINGRLEALRRNALGFRNLTHYRIRSPLHCGNLAHLINAL